ncbi:hypothetical protein ABWH92_12435 [Ahrensia marina]|uniref:hypothetical protein n=1 Tax=Ahrensia marina TaxID=1514904 RepID=UPI0035CF866C
MTTFLSRALAAWPMGSDVNKAHIHLLAEALDSKFTAADLTAGKNRVFATTLAELNATTGNSDGDFAILPKSAGADAGLYTFASSTWTKRININDLYPGGMVKLTVTNTETNALVASASTPLPSDLADVAYLIDFNASNAAGAMTIEIDGTAAIPIKTDLTGVDPAAGAVTAARLGFAAYDGMSLRLFMSGDAAADRAAAELARNQAQTFRNEAEAIVGFDGSAGTVSVSPAVEGGGTVQASLEGLAARSTDLDVQKNGVSVASQPALDFVGNGFGVSDDPSNGRVRVELFQQFLTPQQFGAVADGTTDDSAAFLLMATAYRDVGGKIVIPPGHYVLNLTQGIDLRRTIPQPIGISYEVDATGAFLDFRGSTMTSGGTISIGATAQANMNEISSNVWRGGVIVGPVTETIEDANTYATETTGLNVEWMYGGHVSDVNIANFHKGLRTAESWHFKATQVHAMKCNTGILLQNNMTVGHWSAITSKNNRFGLVAHGYTLGGNIYGQTFTSLNLEGNKVGCVLDPRNGYVRGITFDGPYLEAITYDGFRVGKLWEDKNAADQGGNRSGRSEQLIWRNGIWDGAWDTSNKRAIRFNDGGGDGRPSRILIDNLPSSANSSINLSAASQTDVRP